eukprot:1069413-Prymnesium_polylepis.1
MGSSLSPIAAHERRRRLRARARAAVPPLAAGERHDPVRAACGPFYSACASACRNRARHTCARARAVAAHRVHGRPAAGHASGARRTSLARFARQPPDEPRGPRGPFTTQKSITTVLSQLAHRRPQGCRILPLCGVTLSPT